MPGVCETEATQLYVSDLRWYAKTECQDEHSKQSTYCVVKLPGPLNQLNLKALSDGIVVLAVVGRGDSDGNLFDEQINEEKGLVWEYDNSNVRHVSKITSEDGETPPVSLPTVQVVVHIVDCPLFPVSPASTLHTPKVVLCIPSMVCNCYLQSSTGSKT